jgi:hypothetical protein
MKPVALVLNFLPLIAFSLLAKLLPHNDIGVAGLIAAVCALIAVGSSRPVWPPKILASCSFVLFAVIAVLGFSLGSNDDRWLATWGGAGVGLILGGVILALLPVIPFTEQFARATTPQAAWSSPTFKKINFTLSAVWGLAIFGLGVSRVLAAAVGGRVVDIILGTVVPVVVILYGLKFSKEYPEKVMHSKPADEVAAGRHAAS